MTFFWAKRRAPDAPAASGLSAAMDGDAIHQGSDRGPVKAGGPIG
jgi:hypothetical protein